VLGGVKELPSIVAAQKIDHILVALRRNLPSSFTAPLLECKALGATVEEMPTFYKRLTGKVPIQFVTDTWLIYGPVFFHKSRLATTARRLADVSISLLMGLVALPLVALAAIAIRLESRGSIFYTQERAGRNEQPFQIIKLRTMRQDAEAKTGAVWSAGAGDPRVTRVGRFLRRSRIDELPQLWNVLRGDMSIVGPRPERDHFIRQLKQEIPFYSLRFSVKPGLTGWAQVNYRYGNTNEDSAEKLRFELYEIQEL